jgi:ribosomal protein S18 acetylase RimI-like enzyme
MSQQVKFRTEPILSDVENVSEIVTSTGFFLPHEVPVAVELVQERIEKGLDSGYHFIFAVVENRTVAYACFGEIPCTKGSYDLYWIVTHNDFRGMGIGKKLMVEVEKQIKALDGRVIYIETSSKPQYIPTRGFYENYGCKTEAILKDFYDVGDNKYLYSIWLK